MRLNSSVLVEFHHHSEILESHIGSNLCPVFCVLYNLFEERGEKIKLDEVQGEYSGGGGR